MRVLNVKWARLAVAAGAIVGSALVSSVAVAADESPPIDPPPVTTSDLVPIDVIDPDPDVIDPDPDVIVVDPLPDALFEDIAVIEIVVPETEATEPETIDGASSVDESTMIVPSATAPLPAMETSEPESPETDEHGSDHSGGSGGQSGSGGSGNPFQMTFTVVWQDSDGEQVVEFDVMLPPDLLAEFELLATSRTGNGRNETSATCTYPEGNPVLRCIYEGHGELGSEALIIPGKKDATYTVSVAWPVEGWTIIGADPEQKYTARETCGIESGGDHGTGSEHETGGDHEAAGTESHNGDSDNHGSGGQGGGDAGDGGRVPCVHTVVMRQIASLPPAPPPAPEPPAAAPPITEPAVVPPVVIPTVILTVIPTATPTVPEVQSAAAPRSSLPDTGGSISILLLLAGALVATGSAVAGLTRRTS